MATIFDYLYKRSNVLRTSGPNIFIQCPGCDTRQQKCSIHVNKAIGNCFRASCPLHGGFNFATLITYLDKCSYSEALSIASHYEDDIELEFKSKSYGLNRNYPINSLPIQEFLNFAEKERNKLFCDLATNAVKYLVNKRGLTEKQIDDYKIGVGYEDYKIGEKIIPRYGMIIIPTFFNQQIVSYNGRSIEVGGLSLCKTKHYHPIAEEDYLLTSQVLFNCDTAIPSARIAGILSIVEDRWSAIKLGNAVATSGSFISDEQMFVLTSNYQGPICVVRDNDLGGRKATQQDVKRLSKFYEDIRIIFPKGIDPDDFLNDTRMKIKHSKPIDLFELKLQTAMK